jgi:hypothetical protein
MRADEHPSEELLTSLALDEGQDSVAAHVLSCEDCSRVVNEIRALKDSIVSLPDEEFPSVLRNNILHKKKAKSFLIFRSLTSGSNLWVNNPLILSIGFVLFLTFLYFFIVFILK